MTRHFSQFLFAPYGDGEGLRAVEADASDEQLLSAEACDGDTDDEPRERAADATDLSVWPPLTVVEWPLTHRPFDDDDEPEIADGHFSPADEDPDGEAQEEAAAHAARAALLAEVYGWPHRAI
ncbi:hypothetical protein [Clavibacter nebraskensis]|uniref:Uncharacterized protein n=2 Tax=Clavibacter nebraskensis TaxID=31963 RepID=A0A399QKT3_9MICO|nr:hypothetical protein [Clavibacter nebraskensis]KXU21648.1 hypothetical protein VV38_02065 [Clavibacter nebraskensis]OAH22553.1 hypothetical protein A3Q38_01155 [Clavibacter nebraskensis]QGV65792.1 hypothetical protein EGX36_02420 [Clavibacter nebraskensis]QGV68586.1 hypothetical protein EGX37_02405 [Clavibacter nebraskensis]QGV71377.1 hypothetical protein EGX35_02405 [Clavibacter nebraskensis]